MKKAYCRLLAAAVCFCILFGAHSAGASVNTSAPTITVAVKEHQTLKSRTILSGVSLRIIAKCDGEEISPPALKYRTTNAAVASVSSDGVITTLKDGSADIVISSRDGRKRAMIRLKVRGSCFDAAETDDSAEADAEGVEDLLKGRSGSVWMRTGILF